MGNVESPLFFATCLKIEPNAGAFIHPPRAGSEYPFVQRWRLVHLLMRIVWKAGSKRSHAPHPTILQHSKKRFCVLRDWWRAMPLSPITCLFVFPFTHEFVVEVIGDFIGDRSILADDFSEDKCAYLLHYLNWCKGDMWANGFAVNFGWRCIFGIL